VHSWLFFSQLAREFSRDKCVGFFCVTISTRKIRALVSGYFVKYSPELVKSNQFQKKIFESIKHLFLEHQTNE